MEIGEYEQLVNELETRVDRLRSLYDQYFMGIEKTVPSVPHKDVDRRIQVLRREQIRNTGLRFRFQMILQRYGTYQVYWQRICRQIEEGTYKRHVQKARAKIQEKLAPKRHDSGGYDIDVEFEMEMLDAEKAAERAAELQAIAAPAPEPAPAPATAATPPEPADEATPMIPGVIGPAVPRVVPAARPLWRKVEPAPRPAPAPVAAAKPAAAPAPVAAAAAAPATAAAAAPATAAAAAPATAAKPAAAPPKPAPKPPAPAAKPPSPGDLSEARKRELYARYVEAKRSRGESTVGITYESMSRTLRESSEKLREKHGKSVDFEVTVKDGKTILKPILK